MTIASPCGKSLQTFEVRREHGYLHEVRLTYKTDGPTFVGEASSPTHEWLPSETPSKRQQLYRRAFLDLCDQIDAHNAVTDPYPND